MEYIAYFAYLFAVGFATGLFAIATSLAGLTLIVGIVGRINQWRLDRLERPKPPILTNYVPPFQDLNPLSRHRMGQ